MATDAPLDHEDAMKTSFVGPPGGLREALPQALVWLSRPGYRMEPSLPTHALNAGICSQ